MARSRVRMKLYLGDQAPETSPAARSISRDDLPALGELMLAAYRDTIDYEGETLKEAVAEVRGTLDGQYGPFLGDCSFLIEEKGQLLAACMITWSAELKAPLLTFSMTRPKAQRRGMGTMLIKTSINALVDRGHRDLYLVVTEGNAPALHLYEKMGFRAVQKITGGGATDEGEGR
ncbi:GNAT family N-acetyltransferase [Candidatus Zixiibacteriota bacterium]